MKNFYLFLVLVVGTALNSGCTEDRQLETLLKPEDQIMAKQDIDTEAHYLYVPLGKESSRTTLYGRAYEVGQAKVVKMRVTEFSLDVVSIEKETRFEDNLNNEKLLISIPIEHVDYRCQDDAYGECIGQEVENERIPWDQKTFMRPNFAEATIIDTNFFAYEFAGPTQCYQEEQKELVARSLTASALNFTIKRNYKDQLYFFCIRNHDLSDFTNLNWTETTSYSLVKLDEVASPDYEQTEYHPDWINTFGFFETDDYQLDVDGNASQTGEVKYMQRWNPARKEIVYYLSQSFDKPENAALKKATVESFARINQGLQEAGANFQLRLEEPDNNIDPGDLRNSMVILVDDPLASSVIGYGPSIANPLTGEVISARTIMYSGSIRKFVRFTYDEILRRAEESKVSAPQADRSSSTILGLSQEEIIEQIKSRNFDILLRDRAQAQSLVDLKDINSLPRAEDVDRTPQLSQDDLADFMSSESTKDFIALLAAANKYPAEALSFGDINQDLVQEVIGSIGELQPWENLSVANKQKILDVLTPYVWIPTLVHEIGHNLGLRHNFSGSEDDAHFYSQEELKNLGVPVSTDNIPYSSVMDYPKSEINALRTLGKYDIAALRFGYAGKATLEDGSIVDVISSEPTEGLENFDYCSDEGVAPNPTCNPFDEGVGLKAIANSLIDSYHDRYLRSNFRRGRANFSGMDDDGYLRGLNRTFRTLRLIYERYESLVRNFDLDQETIDSVPFLKEIDESVEIAADFFMSVVATPDTICVVQNVETGVLQIVPIGIFSSLSHDGTRTCQGLQLNEAFTVVAEGGKALNSIKYPSNPNRFADQIDLRGTWINKALAMKTLFQRTLGSTLFDKHNGNFVDHPKSGPKVLAFLRDLFTNQLQTNVDFRFNDGQVISVPMTLDLDASFYEVPTSELPLPHMMLGLPYNNFHLPEILTQTLVQGIDEGSGSNTGDFLKSALAVQRTPQDLSTGDYVNTTSRGQALYARKDSLIASAIINQANRADFFEGLNLSTEALEKVLDLIENPPKEDTEDGETQLVEEVTEGLEPNEKLAYERGPEDIKAYLANPTSSTFLKRILLNL